MEGLLSSLGLKAQTLGQQKEHLVVSKVLEVQSEGPRPNLLNTDPHFNQTLKFLPSTLKLENLTEILEALDVLYNQ